MEALPETILQLCKQPIETDEDLQVSSKFEQRLHLLTEQRQVQSAPSAGQHSLNVQPILVSVSHNLVHEEILRRTSRQRPACCSRCQFIIQLGPSQPLCAFHASRLWRDLQIAGAEFGA